jgi:hypothetical protein
MSNGKNYSKIDNDGNDKNPNTNENSSTRKSIKTFEDKEGSISKTNI